MYTTIKAPGLSITCLRVLHIFIGLDSVFVIQRFKERMIYKGYNECYKFNWLVK